MAEPKEVRQQSRTPSVNGLLTIARWIEPMTQISLDSQSFGVPASDDHCADVRGPGAGYVWPTMMGRKLIVQAALKVVRLSDVYRIPKSVCGAAAENVDASNRVERHSDCVVLKFVLGSAKSSPKESWEGLDDRC
jgi:hypothetical protein